MEKADPRVKVTPSDGREHQYPNKVLRAAAVTAQVENQWGKEEEILKKKSYYHDFITAVSIQYIAYHLKNTIIKSCH